MSHRGTLWKSIASDEEEGGGGGRDREGDGEGSLKRLFGEIEEMWRKREERKNGADGTRRRRGYEGRVMVSSQRAIGRPKAKIRFPCSRSL
jgi:hypothetical protein